MKKLFLSLLMIPVIQNTAFASDIHNDPCENITMPSAEILAERLRKANFGYYDEKTKISQKLGGKEKHPLGIPNLVFQTNYDFNECLGNNPNTAIVTEMLTPVLIKVLLEDHPEAITCLENLGILLKNDSE